MNLPKEITFTAEDIEVWKNLPSYAVIREAHRQRDLGIEHGISVMLSIAKRAVMEYNTLLGGAGEVAECGKMRELLK